MKMLYRVVFVLLLVPFFPAFAFGADGIYTGGNIGYGMIEDSEIDAQVLFSEAELDTGLNLGAVLGYDFGDLRLEGEVGWQKNDFDKWTESGTTGSTSELSGDMSTLSLLVSGYYDFSIGPNLEPFVGIGLGYAKLDANDLGVTGSANMTDDDDTAFVHQVSVGIAYTISEAITIDAKYRYFGADDPEFGVMRLKVQGHGFMVGIRVAF